MIQADLVYARVGGTSLRLDLYTPSEAPSGLPTLLYLHGGAWAVGDKSDAAVERLMPIVAVRRPRDHGDGRRLPDGEARLGGRFDLGRRARGISQVRGCGQSTLRPASIP